MNDSKKWLTDFLANPLNPIGAVACALILLFAAAYWEYTRFMIKSLRRNLLRSVLTALATAFLVLIVTMIWSVLAFIDRQTEAKSKNLKVIVSEKYQIPSQMPFAYYERIALGAPDPKKKGEYVIDVNKDAMYWAFYGGTLDPEHKTRDNTVFFFAMEPSKLINYDANGKFNSMMEDIDLVPEEEKRLLAAACEKMAQDPKLVLIGESRLEAMHKKVGEKIKVTSFNYKDIDLEFEILGKLPRGRYELSAVMNYAYLDQKLQEYNKGKTKDQKHPMTEKTLALVWLRVPNMTIFEKVSQQLTESPEFTSPVIKCETASSGIASFLDAYKTILWGMRWLMGPAILATMSLVIANAISISVRERRVEMAILKVLGFSPNKILLLVLGEALLIGCVTGLLSALATRHYINELKGGIALPIAFFGKFFVENAAPWWGLAVGGGTAFLGSIVPAWSARSVKVTDVFSKIA